MKKVVEWLSIRKSMMKLMIEMKMIKLRGQMRRIKTKTNKFLTPTKSK